MDNDFVCALYYLHRWKIERIDLCRENEAGDGIENTLDLVLLKLFLKSNNIYFNSLSSINATIVKIVEILHSGR